MSKKVFTKPYKGVGEQVQQFADRGMVIDIPAEEAAEVLRSPITVSPAMRCRSAMQRQVAIRVV